MANKYGLLFLLGLVVLLKVLAVDIFLYSI